jgi:hypothetical protein
MTRENIKNRLRFLTGDNEWIESFLADVDKYSESLAAAKPILCLQLIIFSKEIGKNKGRSKTVKPKRRQSLSNMIVTAPFLTRC